MQRSIRLPSSGPSCRFMRAVLYRGESSVRRGDGEGSYVPPLQATDFRLHVSVDRRRASRNSRSAAAIFWASAVVAGIRPSGGSTINEVRLPACLIDWNTAL